MFLSQTSAIGITVAASSTNRISNQVHIAHDDSELIEGFVSVGSRWFQAQFMRKNFMLNSRFMSVFSALAIFAGVSLAYSQSAFAQDAAADPCSRLGATMQERMKIIGQVQGFKDKKPTAQDACAVFTKLSSINKSAIEGLVRDGAWCRAPENFAESLKQQQSQIDQGKANACKAAADQKKMESQKGAAMQGGPKTGPMGGAGDVLGGPVKLPQGAL